MFRSIRWSGLSRLSAIRRRLRVSGWRHAQRLAPIGLFLVVALAWRGVGAAPAADKRAVPEPEAVAQCSVCHDSQAAAWAKSVHRRTVGAPQIPKERQGCTACHQSIDKHLEDPSAALPGLRLTDLKPDQVTAMCLSCHKDSEQIMFRTSAHAKLPRSCLSCHHPHQGEGREMLREPQPELCDKCHPQQAAETRLPSHHPIQEGKMVCTDCHNVHGDQRNNLPAESTPEMCYKCHSDKAGPFAGEHPPVTEDCTICHKPHGSQNDRLLVMDEPILCLRCHPGHGGGHRSEIVPADPANPNPPDPLNGGAGQTTVAIMAFFNRCTSCHALIHGTDLVSSTGNPTFMPGMAPDASLPLGRTSATNAGPFWGLAGVSTLGLEGGGASWGFSELELGQLNEKGNPTFVREYDGKNYEFPQLKLGLDQYAKNSDFHFRLRDPAARDEDAEVYFGNQNVSTNIKYSALTHREPRFNDVRTGPGFDGLPGIPIPTLGSNLIRVEDLTNGKNDFAITRKVAEINVAARHPKLSQVRWLANFWRQSKQGSKQFLFLQRCDGCHKTQIEQPIDQITTEASGGAELQFNRGALRYMHTEGRFENRAAETVFSSFGFGPLAQANVPLFGVADNRTHTDEVRLAALPGAAIALNGLWRNKKRADLYNGTQLDIGSAGGGANWRIAPGLSLVTSYFSNDFDNGARNLNPEAISRDRKTARAEVRYTALKGTTLSAGYKREAVNRDTEHSVVPSKSTANSWQLAAISNLPSGLTLNLRYRKTTTDVDLNNELLIEELVDPTTGAVADVFQSRFVSPPSDEAMLSLVAGYNVTPQLMINALYSKLDQDYDMGIHFINPVTAEPVDVSRFSNNNMKTAGGEVYYDVGRRTKVTAGFYSQQGSGLTDAQFGTEPLTWAGFDWPPIPSTATFSYDAKIWRLDASHWLTPRLRLFGRYGRTRSDGSVIANDLGDFLDGNPDLNGVALLLRPFDITLEDKWLGVSYLVDPFTEVALSFESRRWDNAQDFTQNGSYDLWRIGVRKSL